MEPSLIVSVAVGCLTIIMWLAAFLFEDQEGEKPARYAFHGFYSFSFLLFIVMTFQIYRDNPILAISSDVLAAIMQSSLLIGIIWRCKSEISEKLIYILALIYVSLEIITLEYSIRIALSYIIICSLIASYALFNRRPTRNSGDVGMGVISLCCAGILFIYLLVHGKNVDNSEYLNTIVYIFIFAPAYFSGMTIFLFSSYMIDAKNELSNQAITDPMTGLYNRRYLIDESDKLLSLESYCRYPVSVVLCDIDKFKLVNDNYGHNVGDRVIKAFSSCLQSTIRQGDILVRFGGEEFVIVLPKTVCNKAADVAERMRKKTERMKINTSSGEISITASFGVYEAVGDINIENMIKRADSALYRAKENGRNKVCLYEA